MAQYDKYIDMEFTFYSEKYKEVKYLNYNGIDREGINGLKCAKCSKPLKSKAYNFTDNEEGSEWLFGSECVKYIISAGFGE